MFRFVEGVDVTKGWRRLESLDVATWLDMTDVDVLRGSVIQYTSI